MTQFLENKQEIRYETYPSLEGIFCKPTLAMLIEAINQGKTRLIESVGSEANIKKNNIGNAQMEGGPVFLLKLTTATAYALDINKILRHYLQEKRRLDYLIVDPVITAAYEAISNAILWSNLEISPCDGVDRMLAIDEQITKRLEDPQYAQRMLTIYLQFFPNLLDVTIKSEGKGFDWKKWQEKSRNLPRGLTVMRTFADFITVEAKGRVVRLQFKI